LSQFVDQIRQNPHGIIKELEPLTNEYRQVAEVSLRIQPFYF